MAEDVSIRGSGRGGCVLPRIPIEDALSQRIPGRCVERREHGGPDAVEIVRIAVPRHVLEVLARITDVGRDHVAPRQGRLKADEPGCLEQARNRVDTSSA